MIFRFSGRTSPTAYTTLTVALKNLVGSNLVHLKTLAPLDLALPDQYVKEALLTRTRQTGTLTAPLHSTAQLALEYYSK